MSTILLPTLNAIRKTGAGRIRLYLLAAAVGTVFIGTLAFLYAKSMEKPVTYRMERPFYTHIIEKTVATGKIAPRKEVNIKAQISGVVDSIPVEAGQLVRKGDLIAELRVIPNMQQLNAAESQLEAAKITLRNAKAELARKERLFHDKLVSESEYNDAIMDFELKNEAVSSAQNNVDLIKDGVSKKSGMISNQIYSTLDGMVLDIPVKEGAYIIETNTFNEGTTIATVANMQDMIFIGKVDESEVGKIRVGMPIRLHIGAIESESYDAVLEHISPKGFEDRGAIKFEIRAAIVLGEGTTLRSGYSANADIVLAEKDRALAINQKNLIFENGRTYVDVETSDQEFQRREVVTGLSDGINIEIVSGLGESDRIKSL